MDDVFLDVQLVTDSFLFDPLHLFFIMKEMSTCRKAIAKLPSLYVQRNDIFTIFCLYELIQVK